MLGASLGSSATNPASTSGAQSAATDKLSSGAIGGIVAGVVVFVLLLVALVYYIGRFKNLSMLYRWERWRRSELDRGFRGGTSQVQADEAPPTSDAAHGDQYPSERPSQSDERGEEIKMTVYGPPPKKSVYCVVLMQIQTSDTGNCFGR